jgi:hypothetical protein
MFDKLKDFVFEHKWILIFFIPFLIVQIFHSFRTSWDSIVYLFNGKWFCGEQIYFEFIRPPLPAFLNCLFGANELALVFTAIFASFIFLIGIILIYKKYNNLVDQFIFALFAFLAPWILINFNFGADLLALGFVLIALGSSSLKNKSFAFALATLSRYNFIAFLPFFIFELRKKPKDIINFLIIFLIPWIPWFYFNYLYSGNIIFSVYEAFYLNFVNKAFVAPFLFDQIFFIIFFTGLFFIFCSKTIKFNLVQSSWLSLIMFIISKIKETRFFGLAFIGAAFFAGIVAKKFKSTKILFVLIILLLFLINPPNFGPLKELEIPNDDFIKDCRVLSDNWVYFYPKGILAEPVYEFDDLNTFVLSGGNMVLYSDLKNHNFVGEKIQRDGYVIIKSDTCFPQPKKQVTGILRKEILKWLILTDSNILDYSDWFVDFNLYD